MADNWSLIYDGFNPDEEGLREALCTLGNGYFATRGSGSEAVVDAIHYPGTYLAGGYNRLKTVVSGRLIENEDLVNCPNWLPLTFRIDGGDWMMLKAVTIEEYCQELDLSRGILLRHLCFRDASERITTLDERRLVHMEQCHLAAIEWTITPENWSGAVEICSAVEGKVENLGVARYRNLNRHHLVPVESGSEGDETLFVKMETSFSQQRIAVAARTHVSHYDARDTILEEGYVANHFHCTLTRGESLAVEKVVAIYTSRDNAISECGHEARKSAAVAENFAVLLASHCSSWKALWHTFNVELLIDSSCQHHPELILRLHLFHLLQTVSRHTVDLDVGIPARGWHGEAYRGHIFWDELFILPVFNIRMPEITRSLLKYRYHRLDAARRAARAAGFKGAMFPWQSGSSGREESQQLHLNPESGRWLLDHSSLQRHVNVAIAYNVWRYYEVSGSSDFLSDYGGELMVEIARFWASAATYDSAKERFVINGVMGPDEYHDGYPDRATPGIDNNAYTNIMVAWLMARIIDLIELLPRAHLERLAISDDESALFRSISHNMYVPYHDGGIISQFEGYGNLQEFAWDDYRCRYGDIHRLDRILESEGDDPNRYKLSKQADVLMLFYLFSFEELQLLFAQLGYPFDEEHLHKNIDYYIERTSHGSTLSSVVHAWVCMRAAREESWSLLIQALESDVADVQGGTTQEGIHLGAMAGTVDIIQRCYTGIEVHNNVLWLKPHLPKALKKLAFPFFYRGHSLRLIVDHQKVELVAEASAASPIEVGYYGTVQTLAAGEALRFFPNGNACQR